MTVRQAKGPIGELDLDRHWNHLVCLEFCKNRLAKVQLGTSLTGSATLITKGSSTFLEKKRLSTDCVVDKYPEVWNTFKFCKFEVFTKPRGPYIPNCARKFYSAYGELVPKRKKKANMFNLVEEVMVLGRKVKCSSSDINAVLGCSEDFMHDYINLIKKKTLDDLKGWMEPLISDVIPRWIEAGALIEKKDVNVVASYRFWFTNNTIMPSQNESILRHSKAACLGSIMARQKLNFRLLIEHEMAMRAKQS
uniref:Putative plant transposon protein domain-containing protein n=1 Tax=Solanum tuberosum TaxID=4113 RepID=M1DIQ8_SOLTU